MDYSQLPAQCHVGIEQVDREHLRLFGLIGLVASALDDHAANPHEAARTAAHSLLDYTQTHFASEESLMAAAGYPDLTTHQAKHRDLLRQANDMLLRVEIGDASSILDLSSFLNRWLIQHIQGDDRLFGKFVEANR